MAHRCCLLLLLLAACAPASGAGEDSPDAATADAGSMMTPDAGEPPPPTTGLTADFRAWLTAHGDDVAAFARDDLTGGSFGGRTTPGEALTHDPVIFVHGNSDKALGTATGQTGWTASYQYFRENGYTSAELYATTWGPADAAQASAQHHSQTYVRQLRHFIEAVLAYTGAAHVDLITHSMGVTLTRKAVLGGSVVDGTDQVGPSLTDRVDTFVGIAGANLGLTNCYGAGASLGTCSAVDGFYPGNAVGLSVEGRSQYLDDLLATSGFEGAFRYTLWSSVDEVIGYGDIVYGAPTSRIPGQTGEKVYQAAPYGHFGLKDLTAEVQLRLVRDHVLP